jgi:hypothetical protein
MFRSPALRPRRLVPLLASLVFLVALAPPAAGQPPSGLYRVRAATRVLVCGGFAGRCEVWGLNGHLELAVALPQGPGAQGFVEITGSELTVTTPQGETFPFPEPGDLQLAGLTGELIAGTAELRAEAPGNPSQRVELEILGLERDLGLGGEEGLLLRGLYDQGCCDRFLFQLGNVVLDRVPDRATLLLDDEAIDRFEVTVFWSDGVLLPAEAVPVRLDERSGAFWFFTPQNPEVFVKIVPACVPPFDRVWFFASGLTDVAVTILVTDRESGIERAYGNPPGRPFRSIFDTSSFPCLALP